jgi:putative YhdH/YhfP family quinone oxidoreductase
MLSAVPFKAFLIRQEAGKVVSGFTDMTVDDLDAGEVTVRVAYSSVNYKDALAATGAGRIIRRFPCVGGIDLAGTVIESRAARFAPGDKVFATGFDIGVAHHGGYAEIARLPADWVLPLPVDLSLKESMAIGTAGFTAALSVARMEEHGLKPANGPVLVTGATGGVGSLAIDMLAGRGYHVVALTGKEAEKQYLLDLGAREVMLRQSLDLSAIKPLGKEIWAGAVDNLGGDVLAWLASTMKRRGMIASIGLAAGMNLNTTVAPFILRGVSLLGLDSSQTDASYRANLWQRLVSDLRPRHLAALAHSVAFAELPQIFGDFIQARVKGRLVVTIAGE